MSRPVKDDRRASQGSVEPHSEVGVPFGPGTIDPSAYSASDVATNLTMYGYGGSEPTSGGAVGGMAGCASTPDGLGMTRLAGLFVGPQHANRPAPIEYGSDVARPHAGPRPNEYGETY